MKRKGVFFTIIILMFLVSLILEVNQVKIHIKASNGFPVHNLSTGLNYTSIQAAINALETLDGHVIFVEKGTYFEHVTVDKSLTLLSHNGRKTAGEKGSHRNCRGSPDCLRCSSIPSVLQ